MIKDLSTDTAVGHFVAERPARARVFERLGIDYCCGGMKPLRDACAERGLDAEAVLRELAACEVDVPGADSADWSRASLTALADHIETIHHTYLREALPRLTELVEKVASAHEERHPELRRLQGIFAQFRSDLEAHMDKEEMVLFPICRALDTGEALPGYPGGIIRHPIRVMEHEHDRAGEALLAMRALTRGFTPPEDACGTYRVMLHALAELEADMHWHVHEENNVLFPRAIAADAAGTLAPV